MDHERLYPRGVALGRGSYGRVYDIWGTDFVVKEFAEETGCFTEVRAAEVLDGYPGALVATPPFFWASRDERNDQPQRISGFLVPRGQPVVRGELEKLSGFPRIMERTWWRRQIAQLILPLAVLHKNRLLHADLKRDNVVWNPRAKQFAWIDFGLALKATGGEGKSMFVEAGSCPLVSATSRDPQYMLAEPTEPTPFLIDLWGLATTLERLVAFTHSMKGYDIQKDPEWLDLLRVMRLPWETRPTMAELLSHPFLDESARKHYESLPEHGPTDFVLNEIPEEDREYNKVVMIEMLFRPTARSVYLGTCIDAAAIFRRTWGLPEVQALNKREVHLGVKAENRRLHQMRIWAFTCSVCASALCNLVMEGTPATWREAELILGRTHNPTNILSITKAAFAHELPSIREWASDTDQLKALLNGLIAGNAISFGWEQRELYRPCILPPDYHYIALDRTDRVHLPFRGVPAIFDTRAAFGVETLRPEWDKWVAEANCIKSWGEHSDRWDQTRKDRLAAFIDRCDTMTWWYRMLAHHPHPDPRLATWPIPPLPTCGTMWAREMLQTDRNRVLQKCGAAKK